MPPLARLARWLAGKFAGAALVLALGMAAVGLWLFLQDNAGSERRRGQRLQQIAVERDYLLRARAELEERLAQIARDLQTQQQRVEQAQKVAAALQQLESWWDRVFGNPDQQQANLEQLQRMQQLEADARARSSMLQRQLTQAAAEKEELAAAFDRLGGERGIVEQSGSETLHYLRRAWDQSKWYLAGALLAFFAGPTVWAVLMYFGFAALATRGRPIRFADTLPALPAVGQGGVSIAVTLRAGEVLRMKEKFLQASDEGAARQTRFLLDWRVPLTSLACGLVELVELRSEAGAEYQVTLSNADDPHLELAALELPAGASLILRPSFLAGVIQRHAERLEIKRHWQLARWQSWATGQFRFFEFVGPCRLIVAGSRGVRAETLAGPEGERRPARRTNQDATIGFTPNLDYKPVRAETFWSYYRGMNPLFDDLFAGRGIFLLQETSTPGQAAGAGKFWAGVWSGLLKVFGL